MGSRSCIARIVALPFGALEPQRASESSPLLAPALALEREIDAECEALSAELYGLAGGRDETGTATERAAQRRNSLLALRRDVFHRRVRTGGARIEGVPPALDERVVRLAGKIARLQRET